MPQGFPLFDERAKAAGRKGGQRTQEKRRTTERLWWQAKAPGVDVEVIKALYKDGYAAGWQAGSKHGYRVWAEARES